ncbi:hypothetical protein PAPYR_7581 [Paratrimastix pyriformis]|uniref:Reverse transcriptase/retrotransposon-derived protein RNase H-like domain-containing protein n=1 Tax=Paratrimastix pyriformis TaxID=342808 RepID=A0ABQ8UFC3_9EUKA|nr:hypothetical protein PAPYR_7581 [Paratrimastix pyriformis]
MCCATPAEGLEPLCPRDRATFSSRHAPFLGKTTVTLLVMDSKKNASASGMRFTRTRVKRSEPSDVPSAQKLNTFIHRYTSLGPEGTPTQEDAASDSSAQSAETDLQDLERARLEAVFARAVDLARRLHEARETLATSGLSAPLPSATPASVPSDYRRRYQRFPPHQGPSNPVAQQGQRVFFPPLAKLEPEEKERLRSLGICVRCRGMHPEGQCPRAINDPPSRFNRPPGPAPAPAAAARDAARHPLRRVLIADAITMPAAPFPPCGVVDGDFCTTAVLPDGRGVPALLDSGARTSVIDSRLVSSLGLVPTPGGPHILAADGFEIPSKGLVRLPLRFTPDAPTPTTITAQVVDGLHQPEIMIISQKDLTGYVGVLLPDERGQLVALIYRHRNAFGGVDSMPAILEPFHVDLVPGSRPVSCPRRMRPADLDFVKAELGNCCCWGLFGRPPAHGPVPLPWPGRGMVTIQPPAVLPAIDDLLHRFQGQRYVAKFDCSAGFHQIQVDPSLCLSLPSLLRLAGSSSHACPSERTAPLHFQHQMDLLLQSLGSWSWAYQDDIAVVAPVFTLFLTRLDAFFTLVEARHLRLKAEKCLFAAPETPYLGFIALLATAPLLAHPDSQCHLLLRTDASSTGLGAVLLQVRPDGREEVLGFYGRKLLPAETKYPTGELELR